jgi:hypothetical protein
VAALVTALNATGVIGADNPDSSLALDGGTVVVEVAPVDEAVQEPEVSEPAPASPRGKPIRTEVSNPNDDNVLSCEDEFTSASGIITESFDVAPLTTTTTIETELPGFGDWERATRCIFGDAENLAPPIDELASFLGG